MTGNGGPGTKVTAKQERAIMALLAQPTIGLAAKQCGVGETTLRRWLRQPAFASAYQDARREAARQAFGHLHAMTAAATVVLGAVMADRSASPASRVTAARAVLDLTLKIGEMEELEARVQALEAGLEALLLEGRP